MTEFIRLAALILAVAPVIGASTARADATVSRASTAALELAKQMAPRALVLDAKLREYDRNFSKALLLNEDIKALEAEAPGIGAAITAASRPLMAEQTAKLIDQVHVQLADFLAAEFSADELSNLAKFYNSPHAQSMNRSMVGSVDQSASYKSMAETGAVDPKTVDEQRRQAIKSTVQKLSDEDTQFLLAFAKTPTFSKLSKVRPRIRELIVKNLTALDPVYEKRIEAAIDKAIESHLASSENKASK